MPREIQSQADLKALIDEPKLVLLDFYTDWCGPCKAMAPLLVQLEAELGDRVLVAKINAEKVDVKQFQIKGYPTLIISKQWAQVARMGGIPGTYPRLKAFVEPHL